MPDKATVEGSLERGPPCGSASGLLSGTALATPPQTVTTHEEGSLTIDCGTFTLHEDFVDDDRVTYRFDRHGVLSFVTVHERFRGLITNPAGETFKDPQSFTLFIDVGGTPTDPSDDTVTFAGLIRNIHVRGSGSVAHDAGLITIGPGGTVVLHGVHEVFEQGLQALICDDLAP